MIDSLWGASAEGENMAALVLQRSRTAKESQEKAGKDRNLVQRGEGV